jgi:hypothetical protein
MAFAAVVAKMAVEWMPEAVMMPAVDLERMRLGIVGRDGFRWRVGVFALDGRDIAVPHRMGGSRRRSIVFRRLRLGQAAEPTQSKDAKGQRKMPIHAVFLS